MTSRDLDLVLRNARVATASDTSDSNRAASTGWLNVTVATIFLRFGSSGS